MEERNKYGFVSGGWIFDYMDRKALYVLNKVVKNTANRNFYTASAKIDFKQQLCNTDNLMFDFFVMIESKRCVKVGCSLWQNAKDLIAKADFVFVEAKENKCKIKE